jgi:hypothetical protein
VSLDRLTPYLSPDDAELAARYVAASEVVQAEVEAYGKVRACVRLCVCVCVCVCVLSAEECACDSRGFASWCF